MKRYILILVVLFVTGLFLYHEFTNHGDEKISVSKSGHQNQSSWISTQNREKGMPTNKNRTFSPGPLAVQFVNSSSPDKGLTKNRTSEPCQEGLLTELDPETLLGIAISQDLPLERRSRALHQLLGKLANERDREYAFNTLKTLKDEFSGEDQQFLLKALSKFSDLGANEEIVDSFLRAGENVSDIEKTRMLSYIDASRPLSEDITSILTDLYQKSNSEVIKDGLLEIIVASGGEKGLSWIANSLAYQADPSVRERFYRALGDAGSKETLQYLNEVLNQKITQDPQNKKEIKEIRDTILRLNKGSK